MKKQDFRSDTVTLPSPEMREYMFRAEVGDDVYGDDPSVQMLEDYAAEKFGFEAALFAPSGTATNLLALLSHCQRGDEYIVGQDAHTYRYEGGGAAVLGSIQPQPIEFANDGTLDLEQVAAKIKPDDFHFAKTRLLCLENTQNGRVLPFEYLENAHDFAQAHGLALHLDGARLFNAAAASNRNIKEITTLFNSVSLCLSKGLGAPAGSILCGNSEFIKSARRWRKMTGGGMRQVGFLAAAGLYALENNCDRLINDHHNAQKLAAGLETLAPHCQVIEPPQTNMVFVRFASAPGKLSQFLQKRGIIISEGETTRLVTHLDISSEDIDIFIAAVKDFFNA